MNQKKKLSRKVISYVLALMMVFSTLTGIAPGTRLTAYAADITGVVLDKPAQLTVEFNECVAITATVSPDSANNTVIWEARGGQATFNTGAVKLYTDESCTTEVGTEPTTIMTVYAKGVAVGKTSVFLTATNGTDTVSDDKTTKCHVTVNQPNTAYGSYIPTGKADEDLTKKQVTFNGSQWYIIEDNTTSATAGTVTLFAADQSFGKSVFDDNIKNNNYEDSDVKTYLANKFSQNFAIFESGTVIDNKLYLLSYKEANALPTA